MEVVLQSKVEANSCHRTDRTLFVFTWTGQRAGIWRGQHLAGSPSPTILGVRVLHTWIKEWLSGFTVIKGLVVVRPVNGWIGFGSWSNGTAFGLPTWDQVLQQKMASLRLAQVPGLGQQFVQNCMHLLPALTISLVRQIWLVEVEIETLRTTLWTEECRNVLQISYPFPTFHSSKSCVSGWRTQRQSPSVGLLNVSEFKINSDVSVQTFTFGEIFCKLSVHELNTLPCFSYTAEGSRVGKILPGTSIFPFILPTNLSLKLVSLFIGYSKLVTLNPCFAK